MPRLEGTITIAFGDDETDLVALKRSVLTYNVAGNEHANIADLTFGASSPEMVDWQVSATANYLDDDAGYVNAAQAAFETLALDRTEFNALFTTPSGVTYYGRCFVKSFGPVSADQTVLGFTATLQGSGVLVNLTEAAGSLDWCPIWQGYFRIYSSYAEIYLGYDAGWVFVARTAGVPDNIEIKDENGTIIHTAGPNFYLSSGTWFYWDPDPEDSVIIHIENDWVNPPLFPAWLGYILCPAETS